jgi:NAD(P)-dependent dehydrogenase (short-subunit alcohol dehydrogenase family)
VSVLPEPSGVRVVLGGTGAIGSAVARRIAQSDTPLVLGYLENHARAERLADSLRGCGCVVRLVPGNIADPPARDALVRAVDELGGRCSALIHAVGLTSFKPLARVRPPQWDLVFGVSARSLLDTVTSLLEPLSAGNGTVVAISSQGASRFVPGYGALGPAKAALEATVRQLACELAPRGVRVNAIRAGLIESDAVEHLGPQTREAVIQRTPFGRLGTPDEIAAVTAFLIGRESSWIVGQVVEVDGGFCVT